MFMGEDCETIAHDVGCAKHYYYIGIPRSRMLLLIIVNFFMTGIDEVFNGWEHFSVCHNCLEFIVFHGPCHITKPLSNYPSIFWLPTKNHV
jgi:hypothetical protein